MPKRPTILIAIDPWPGYRRELIAGVLRYAHRHTAWRFVPDWRRSYEGATVQGLPPVDGIVTMQHQSPLVRTLAAAGVPTVGLQGLPPGPRTAEVLRDNRAIGRMAFAHLRGLGFQRFAGLKMVGMERLVEEIDAFAQAASDDEYLCLIHDVDERYMVHSNNLLVLTREWDDWIAGLKKPLAIYSPRLEVARTLAFALHQAGVLVPEEVAILAGGGDELMSGLSIPPLSTIDRNLGGMGYEAARLLDLMLRNEPLPDHPPVIQPLGLIQRQSTDTLAIEHPAVARAMRIIRDEACEPLSVEALLRRVPLGRRALEQTFKRIVGRTLNQEITRVRMQHAKMLLAQTELSISHVAGRCGYDYASRFSHGFKRELGISPLAYRKQYAQD